MPTTKTNVIDSETEAIDKWQHAKNMADAALGEFSKKMVGRDREFKVMLIALFSNGHVLLEGDAGTGKTESAKAFADLLNVGFSRIQFTPDLMPSSITGGHIYNQKTENFEFRKGPIFSNVVLGDEINRASPKVQAATLEAMAEGKVTSEGETFELPDPFMLIATQNPLEYEGTYPLPINQEDRFLMWTPVPRLTDSNQLAEVARRNINGGHVIQHMLGSVEISAFRDIRKEVVVSDEMYGYMSGILGAVNAAESVESGPGERAMIALTRVAQSHALIDGRSAVEVSDVRAFAPNVLMHRTRLKFDADDDSRVSQVIEEAISSVKAPKARR